MSGAPRARPKNVERKHSQSPARNEEEDDKPVTAQAVLRRQEMLLRSMSMNASCSSDASTDSFCSRASTGRIGRRTVPGRRYRASGKMDRVLPDGMALALPEVESGRRRCSWVTRNTDLCYAAYHDEEWGVPVHDDRKLFELLILSGALAELTWPAILSKRHMFREVFKDFDPFPVSMLNEKKLVAPGSTASSLLSEPKLRAVVENARQILKIIEEFGSFDNYCWSFVSYKPIVSRFRYPRQVPVKTPKADVISKDLVRRGFRSVSPTVIYSFMQAAGITNDHLISCYRFEECALATAPPADLKSIDAKDGVKVDCKDIAVKELEIIDFELPSVVDELNISL